MKRLVFITGALVIFGAFAWQGGSAVLNRQVSTAGSDLAGIPFTIGDISVNPFTGSAVITDLVLHSVEPFTAPEVVRVGSVSAQFDPLSLASGFVIIEEIIVDGAQLTLEQQGTQLNVRQLAERFAAYAAEADTSASMRVFVRELRFSNGQGTLLSDLGNKQFQLDGVVLRDIGSESTGTPMEIAANRVLEPLLVETIKSAGLPTGGLNRLRGLFRR